MEYMDLDDKKTARAVVNALVEKGMIRDNSVFEEVVDVVASALDNDYDEWYQSLEIANLPVAEWPWPMPRPFEVDLPKMAKETGLTEQEISTAMNDPEVGSVATTMMAGPSESKEELISFLNGVDDELRNSLICAISKHYTNSKDSI